MMKASLVILAVFVVAVSGHWKWSRRRHRPTITPDCTLPADSGRCWFRKRTFIRYFFNEKTEKCEVFRYSGCKGNSNRFRSLQSCQDECGEEKNGGGGDGDNMGGGGDGDNMGGGGDGDNMGGGHIPTITPDCTLPADSGRCWFRKRTFIRYFFNEETGKCEVFRYSGCKGNSNRFRSLQSCQDECGEEKNGGGGDGDHMGGGGDGDNMGGGGDGDNMGSGGDGDNMGGGGDGDNMGGGHRPTITPDCTLPVDPGRCWFRKRTFIRYFFNEETGKCKVFRYSGCKGNSNRFRSLQSCQDECGNGGNGGSGGDGVNGGNGNGGGGGKGGNGGSGSGEQGSSEENDQRPLPS